MSALALLRHPVTHSVQRFRRAAGGRARGRVLVLLACVLGLDTADVSMIGSVAGKLETALSLSNLQLGLLAAVPSLIAAFATLPMGVLTDRVNRVKLMAGSSLAWSAAMVASGLAPSFEVLLLTRVLLGAAAAAAGPAVASLVGDYFPAGERARMYGLILSGELVGAGLGFIISGEFADALGWRAAFFVLAVPSAAVAIAVWKLLREPRRGGQSQLALGAGGFDQGKTEQSRAEAESAPERSVVQRKVDEQGIAPRPELALHGDPAQLGLWAAVRYVLRVRTNLVLIVASALGYFYLNGIQTFGLVYFRGHYGISHSAATLLLAVLGAGALVGVLSGGRLADRLVKNGRLDGRILVGGVSSLGAALLFLPALLSSSLLVSLPLFVLGAAAFAARNPALDAARLDLMHHLLWGRAEAIRTVLRRSMVATAPLIFGLMADQLAAPAGGSGQRGFGASASAPGLQAAFLILLVTLVLGGMLTLRARKSYPRDVASAVASEVAFPAS